jgi:hypothetical protein
MYAIGVAEDRPKPRDLVPTDEENVKLQGSMFAYAGHRGCHCLSMRRNDDGYGTNHCP